MILFLIVTFASTAVPLRARRRTIEGVYLMGIAWRCLAIGCFAAAIWQTGEKQVALKPANGTIQESFTTIGSITELSDGRILINDPRDNRLVIADFKSGVRQVGRVGQGPGEYSHADPVYPIGGDSSLMFSLMERRVLLLVGDKIVHTFPPDARLSQPHGSALPTGGALGKILQIGNPRGVDSSFAELMDMKTGQTDTIGTYRVLPRKKIQNGPEPKVPYTPNPLYDPVETAAIARDGWIAFTRVGPYRVDWRTPDGKWIRGKPIPARPVKLDAREKAAFLARMRRDNPRYPEVFEYWPPVIPVIKQNGGELMLSRDGKAVIARNPTADNPGNRYDVISRDGVLEWYFVLPANEQVIGFGKKSIFIKATDDDGLVSVRRHPWP